MKKDRWRWVQTFSGDSTEFVDEQINETAKFADADIIQITSVIQKSLLQSDSYIVSVLFEVRRETKGAEQ